MERATGTEVYGCGSAQTTDITLNIHTTTGGNFSISLNGKSTVEHLKKLISKKLRVPRDRICLLHRDRQLTEGTLDENSLMDGSRVVLLPSVETGLLSQRTDNSVMQALESLNDAQVNDFLSGKSPLNLTMRLGDHMMLIQLQLSTLHGAAARNYRNAALAKTAATAVRSESRDTPTPQDTPMKSSDNAESSDVEYEETEPRLIAQKDLDMIQDAFELYRKVSEAKFGKRKVENNETKGESEETTNLSDLSDTSVENDQSPIKSLSNLVSSPIDASAAEKEKVAQVNAVRSNILDFFSPNKLTDDAKPSTSAMSDKPGPSTSSQTPDSSLSDDSTDNFTDQSSFLAESTIDEYPMENLFNSAVDKGLFEDQDETMMDREISNLATTSHGSDEPNGTLPSFQSTNEPLKNKRFQYLLHKTSKFKHPIGQNKQKAFMQSVVNKHKKRMQNLQENNPAQPSTSRTEPFITNSRKLILQPSSGQTEDNETPSTSKQGTFRAPIAPKKPARVPPAVIDTKALLEASKNLTQKLKKLSKEVLTSKVCMKATEENLRNKIASGAVIETMKHHGKGIYSGTFSGTLNPALQDKFGRPKRDISTIIHILNDLLCAAPPSLALSSKDPKHTCAGSSRDDSSKCLGCSQPSCKYGQCDGHATKPTGKRCLCERPDCQSTRLEPEKCPACAKSNITELCKKCETAKALAIENSKTKCKLEQLRLVMQQKKQRREARKLKTLPYTSVPPKITSPEQTPIKEEIETVA